jgi:hypothetical protein
MDEYSGVAPGGTRKRGGTTLGHLSPVDQVARFMEAVQTFAAGARQADDITALRPDVFARGMMTPLRHS